MVTKVGGSTHFNNGKSTHSFLESTLRRPLRSKEELPAGESNDDDVVPMCSRQGNEPEAENYDTENNGSGLTNDYREVIDVSDGEEERQYASRDTFIMTNEGSGEEARGDVDDEKSSSSGGSVSVPPEGIEMLHDEAFRRMEDLNQIQIEMMDKLMQFIRYQQEDSDGDASSSWSSSSSEDEEEEGEDYGSNQRPSRERADALSPDDIGQLMVDVAACDDKCKRRDAIAFVESVRSSLIDQLAGLREKKSASSPLADMLNVMQCVINCDNFSRLKMTNSEGPEQTRGRLVDGVSTSTDAGQIAAFTDIRSTSHQPSRTVDVSEVGCQAHGLDVKEEYFFATMKKKTEETNALRFSNSILSQQMSEFKGRVAQIISELRERHRKEVEAIKINAARELSSEMDVINSRMQAGLHMAIQQNEALKKQLAEERDKVSALQEERSMYLDRSESVYSGGRSVTSEEGEEEEDDQVERMSI